MPSPAHIPNPRRAGMTLIEIMIVVVILAIAAGGVTMGFGAFGRAKVRAATSKLAAAVDFARGRAIARGNTVRITIAFGEGYIQLDEAHGAVTLAGAGDERRERTEEEREDGAAVDPWAAAQERVDETFQPSFGRSPFGPIQDDEGRNLDRYTRISLDGIVPRRVYVAHQEEPIEEGRAHLYFFPNGETEHAVVQFMDDSERIYSVEIRGLTGVPRVYDYAYEPTELSAEDEVRDPG